jgi:hypothetical protein
MMTLRFPVRWPRSLVRAVDDFAREERRSRNNALQVLVEYALNTRQRPGERPEREERCA